MPDDAALTVQGLKDSPPRSHAFIHKNGCEYKVNSPALVNGHGREFRIKNLTTHAAIVTLPQSVVGGRVPAFDVAAGATVPIPLHAGAAGSHTYSVVMRVDADLVTAHGNSDPVIIIDPPAN